MQIQASDEGEVAPGSSSEKQDICPGEHAAATIESGNAILDQPERKPFVGEIIEDPITGLPVLTFGPDAPVLASEIVADMLADFP
jgi:hypothetical protein